jgi:SAM-dependent methyltransferase
MRKNPYQTEWEVERYHWWFSVRRRLLLSLLPSMDRWRRGIVIDVGCGVGSNLCALRSAGLNVIGLDLSFDNLSMAQQKAEIPLVNADLSNLPFRARSTSAIVAMDVLEHIENDSIGIRELYRSLGDGGFLLLTVPAFHFLWGVQDAVTGHKRRYSKNEILEKLRRENFEIVKSSHFNFFLFFPILFSRCIIRLFGVRVESENKINAPGLNFFLKVIFSIEPYLLRYISFPFGVSIFCLARKGKET